jgi:hypothetical protein
MKILVLGWAKKGRKPTENWPKKSGWLTVTSVLRFFDPKLIADGDWAREDAGTFGTILDRLELSLDAEGESCTFARRG